MEATANGSELGVEVKVVEVSGESTTGNMSNYLTIEGGRYVFNTPKNQTGKTRYYRITASSVENPGAKVEINITVESEDVNADKTYTVLIDNNGDTGTQTSVQKKSGETVTITAQAAGEDREFVRWVVMSGGATLANEYAVSTTFQMPANDVTIKAEYRDKPAEPTYLLIVNGGASNKGNKVDEGYQVKAGETVTITADDHDPVKNWTYSGITPESGGEDGDTTLVFVMPAAEVTITVNFVPKQDQ